MDTTTTQTDLQETVIQPPKKWISLDFPEMWRYRDLLFFLIWRDIKVKYKQTLLGFAWAVLVPVCTMVVFGVVFGKIGKLASNGLPHNIFYFAGLVPWYYFANSLTMSSNSLVGQAHLLTKIYLPRLFIPLSACVATFADFTIAFIVLIIMMFCYGIVPAVTIILVPLLMFIAFATVFGTGLILSSLNVKYRDIKYVVPFLIQMWMYCSVLLPFSSIPQELGVWRYAYGLNPMAGVVEGCRWCLMNHKMTLEEVLEEKVLENRTVPENLGENERVKVVVLEGQGAQVVLEKYRNLPVDPPWPLLAAGLPVALALLFFGLFYFRRMEKMFADII